MRFGNWNAMSLYSAGSFTAAVRELARYKLGLVGVQEIWWNKLGMKRTGDYNFFYGNSIVVNPRIISAVKRGVIYSSERWLVKYHCS
jgi:hypothetical protein